jgi:putative Holliday junction resolvase
LRVIALDVGQKRIGVALSDPGQLLATPLTTIESEGEAADVETVLRLATEHEVVEIIVGIPISLSGGLGPQARLISKFTEYLSTHATVPVTSVDERYSTVEAKRLLRASGVKPSGLKAQVDAAAAAVILQSYLDARRSGLGPEPS